MVSLSAGGPRQVVEDLYGFRNHCNVASAQRVGYQVIAINLLALMSDHKGFD